MIVAGSVPRGTLMFVWMAVGVFFGTVIEAGPAVTARPVISKSAVARIGDRLSMVAELASRLVLSGGDFALLRFLSLRCGALLGLTPALWPTVLGMDG